MLISRDSLVAISLLLLTLLSSFVFADPKMPCAVEVKKYCRRVKKSDAVVACLKKHESDLSAVCKEELHAAPAENGEAVPAPAVPATEN